MQKTPRNEQYPRARARPTAGPALHAPLSPAAATTPTPARLQVSGVTPRLHTRGATAGETARTAPQLAVPPSGGQTQLWAKNSVDGEPHTPRPLFRSVGCFFRKTKDASRNALSWEPPSTTPEQEKRARQNLAALSLALLQRYQPEKTSLLYRNAARPSSKKNRKSVTPPAGTRRLRYRPARGRPPPSASPLHTRRCGKRPVPGPGGNHHKKTPGLLPNKAVPAPGVVARRPKQARSTGEGVCWPSPLRALSTTPALSAGPALDLTPVGLRPRVTPRTSPPAAAAGPRANAVTLPEQEPSPSG